ncbi:hypothetical protein H0H81_006810 [Sphagnurus paluster]|uniref:Uncharacterized protein n=1 Tax=Sphagnurus paluster TaxID=117069 RepID=A0A9P7KKQ3_9AGAR|nr:hypothetical protein H0H81_006810 [Sphagnurus paluster]
MFSVSKKLQRYYPLLERCRTAARGCLLNQHIIASAVLPASILIYRYIIRPTKLDQYLLEPITHFSLLAVKQYFTNPALIGISLLPWVGGAIYDHIIVPRFVTPPTPEFIVDDQLPVDDSPHPSYLPVKIEAQQLSREETCPFIISMKVGKDWSVPPSMNIDITPTQEIYLMANWTKNKAIIPQHRFLSVHAELENAPGLYSAADGYRELGQHVASLGRKVPFERWGELTVRLPAELGEIEYPSASYEYPPIPTDELRNLRWLTWSGRPAQLISPSSWLPFSEPLLRPLVELTLTCNISLDDFSRILFCAVQLQTLEVHSIDHQADSVLKDIPGGLHSVTTKTPRRSMESLTLTSSEDITPIFSHYSFATLRMINFDLAYQVTDIHKIQVPWKNLKTVLLKSHSLSLDNSDWIRYQCPLAKHEHISVKTIQNNVEASL